MKNKMWAVLTKFLLGSYSSGFISDTMSTFFAHGWIMFTQNKKNTELRFAKLLLKCHSIKRSGF